MQYTSKVHVIIGFLGRVVVAVVLLYSIATVVDVPARAEEADCCNTTADCPSGAAGCDRDRTCGVQLGSCYWIAP